MTSSPIQSRIGSVFVPVTDLHRAKGFYCMILGVPIDPSIRHEHLYWFKLANGTDLILDSKVKRPEGDPYPLFYFDTERIEAAYQFLKENGVEIEGEIRGGGGVST